MVRGTELLLSQCSCMNITFSGSNGEYVHAFPLFQRVSSLIYQSFPLTRDLYTAEGGEWEMWTSKFLLFWINCLQMAVGKARKNQKGAGHRSGLQCCCSLAVSRSPPGDLGALCRNDPGTQPPWIRFFKCCLASIMWLLEMCPKLMGCIILNRASWEEWSHLCLYPQLNHRVVWEDLNPSPRAVYGFFIFLIKWSLTLGDYYYFFKVTTEMTCQCQDWVLNSSTKYRTCSDSGFRWVCVYWVWNRKKLYWTWFQKLTFRIDFFCFLY